MTDRSMNIHNSPHLDTMYCMVCNGTGKVFEEHPDGTLSEDTCPYCHGAKNSTWVRQRFDAKESDYEWIRMGIIAWWMGTWWATGYSHKPALIAVGWVLGLIGGMWMFTHPKPSKRRQRKLAQGPRHDPMTTDKERLMGGVVLGGALLKAEWEHRHRQQ